MNFCQLRLLEKGAFEKLANLVELDLSDNYLNAVPTAALTDISGLRNLYLARNNLGPLQASIFTSVPSLVRLDWLFQRNVAASIPPHCDSPERLKGRGWQTLGEDEFVCVPLVTAVAQRVLASHGDNVSLACRVETDPNAAVTWLWDDRPVINTSAQTDHRYRVLELVAPKRDARVSNLTIAGAAVQDQGIYRFNKFKVVNENSLITSKDSSGDQIIFEKLNPPNPHSTTPGKNDKQNTLGLKGISKTVSYVEMPKSESGEADPLLKEIYKETSFVRSSGFTSSQTSLIGYSSPFPDLLDLPTSNQMGSVDRLPFCTMPRRSF
ncbi:hypothetical protein HAZT_HAZT007687 [Hyalella azteca]|uniref:Ig-like domain-containing protein n=1 Tax=Hyalella azteca TaxID=294128 RepID=A0A6A0GYA1_HYAAZ|nr:hypothetical protein HAZT_HAZT007687 [Hyalella azteca]